MSQSAETNGSLLHRIIALLGSRKATLAGVLAASLALNVLGLVAPRFTQEILDNVLPQRNLGLLTRLILVLSLATAAQIALTLWRRIVLVGLSLTVDRVVLAEFLGHVLSLPVSVIKRHKTGDLVARWSEHAHVRHLLAGGLTRVAIDTLMIAVYFAVMFAYSVQLALVVVGLLVSWGAYMVWRDPVMRRQHRRMLEEKAAQEARLIEIMTAIELIKATAIEDALHQRWEKELQRYLATNYRTQKLRQLLESGGTAIQFLCTGALLWYGAVLVLQDRLSAGALVAFSMYATQALMPLLSLISLWDDVQLARGALERIEEIRTQPAEARLGATGPAPRVKGAIRFEDVWFRYEGPRAHEVLRGVTFEAVPGQCLALLGPNGSGKSTVARLLLGLHRPTRGRILVDGVQLEHLELRAYRRQVGAVLQENVLFSGTIAENITLGEAQPDLERVMQVARLTAAHDFIMALPQGYSTIVGELGLTLSGGQRQRIGLARALYREPRVLVLDEPFAALDTSSTQAIGQNWKAIMGGRTVLIIAHDLLATRVADRILVLDRGTILEGESGFRGVPATRALLS